MCKLVCTGITLDDPKKSELAGRFRAAPDDLFPAFPDGIAAFNEACQQEEVQQNGAHKREEPSERMLPFAVPCHEAQKQEGQQGSPDLPAHGVLVIAEGIRQLKRLLDFLEEHLHAQVELVKLAGCEGRPFRVVGDEGHFSHFSLAFNFIGQQPKVSPGYYFFVLMSVCMIRS